MTVFFLSSQLKTELSITLDINISRNNQYPPLLATLYTNILDVIYIYSERPKTVGVDY